VRACAHEKVCVHVPYERRSRDHVGHPSNDVQIDHRSTRKGGDARGPAQKSPRACTGYAIPARRAPGVSSALDQAGGLHPGETPLASKMACKLQLDSSQVT
jgi:hypothetical protein